MIVWFKGINKASDDFMDLLTAVNKSNKDGFKKAVDKFVTQLRKGTKPTSLIFKPVINESVIRAWYDLGVKEKIITYDYNTFKKMLPKKYPDFEGIMAKMLFNGCVSDWNDDQSNLRSYVISKENKDFLSEKSVSRGKEKLSVMLGNKGL